MKSAQKMVRFTKLTPTSPLSLKHLRRKTEHNPKPTLHIPMPNERINSLALQNYARACQQWVFSKPYGRLVKPSHAL